MMGSNEDITVTDDFRVKYCERCKSRRCIRTQPWIYGCEYYQDYIKYKAFEDKLLDTVKEYGEIRKM